MSWPAWGGRDGVVAQAWHNFAVFVARLAGCRVRGAAMGRKSARSSDVLGLWPNFADSKEVEVMQYC